jgi:hypothetical protein
VHCDPDAQLLGFPEEAGVWSGEPGAKSVGAAINELRSKPDALLADYLCQPLDAVGSRDAVHWCAERLTCKPVHRPAVYVTSRFSDQHRFIGKTSLQAPGFPIADPDVGNGPVMQRDVVRQRAHDPRIEPWIGGLDLFVRNRRPGDSKQFQALH